MIRRRPRASSRRPAPARVVAFGSGKGGIGRTTASVELARALARHDQDVLLVDVDPTANGLAAMIDLDENLPVVVSDDPVAFQEVPVECAIGGVFVVGLEDGPRLLYGRDPADALDRVRELMIRLRASTFDWIVLDLPPGFATGTVALFTSVDMPILVANGEPVTLAAATQFLRRCLLASVAQHQAPDVTWAVRTMAEQNPLGWSFQDLYEHIDERGQHVLEEACYRLAIGLLMNQVREGSEHEQAVALCHGWAVVLGIWPRYLGGLSSDDRRWFYARRLAPANHHPADQTVAGDADALAKRLLAIDWQNWVDPSPCLPLVDPAEEPRIFLSVDDVSPGEVRQSYRRLWEGYRREQGLVSVVVDDATRQQTIGLLETAYRKVAVGAGNAAMATDSGQQASVSRSAPSLRQHPGQRMRLARMRQGLGLRELSLRTRVGMKHINAMEAAIVRELPAPAYLKGYLSEIAVTLGMDPDSLIADYLAYLSSPG